MMLASATAEYLINRIKDEAFRNSLTDAVTRLIRMKKLRLRQTIIGCITLVVVWLPWLAYEFSHHFDGLEFSSVNTTIAPSSSCHIIQREFNELYFIGLTLS